MLSMYIILFTRTASVLSLLYVNRIEKDARNHLDIIYEQRQDVHSNIAEKRKKQQKRTNE